VLGLVLYIKVKTRQKQIEQKLEECAFYLESFSREISPGLAKEEKVALLFSKLTRAKPLSQESFAILQRERETEDSPIYNEKNI
jgi:hypothetical protein